MNQIPITRKGHELLKKELQQLTDQSVEKINELGESKHDEVMHV